MTARKEFTLLLKLLILMQSADIINTINANVIVNVFRYSSSKKQLPENVARAVYDN